MENNFHVMLQYFHQSFFFFFILRQTCSKNNCRRCVLWKYWLALQIRQLLCVYLILERRQENCAVGGVMCISVNVCVCVYQVS